jgi:hypothetical protein
MNNKFKNIPITNKYKWIFGSYFCYIKNGYTIKEEFIINDKEIKHNTYCLLPVNGGHLHFKEGITIFTEL